MSVSRRGTLASLVGVGGLGVLSNPVGAAVEGIQWRTAATAAPAPQYGLTATFPNPEPPETGDDEFSQGVAVSGNGNTAFIGAPDDGESGAGRIFVYSRSGEGWQTEDPAVIPSSRPDEKALFGTSVASSADGTTALVSAPGAVAQVADRAYVFSRTGGEWNTEDPVVLPNPDPNYNDIFGEEIALSADGATALVGSPNDNVGGEKDVGKAYVFERTDGGWNAEDPITLPNPDPDKEDNFGSSVAVSAEGRTALVGAPNDDTDDTQDLGAVYVFRRTADGWQTEDPVKISNPAPDKSDSFGGAVVLSGDGTTALMSANIPDSLTDVYVFERTSEGWTVTASLSNPASDPDFESDLSGLALNADGSVALASVPSLTVDGKNDVERGYVFTRTGGEWNTENPAVLANPKPNAADSFGRVGALSADGATALIGTPNNQSEDAQESPAVQAIGEAYLFEKGAEDGGEGGGKQPTVTFEEQDSDGTTVVVQSATLPEGGFIVIHDESGAVLGHSAYLDAGTHENVAVTLDDSISADQTLIAMLHVDDGDQTYEFPDADGPYTRDGEPVTDDAAITLIC